MKNAFICILEYDENFEFTLKNMMEIYSNFTEQKDNFTELWLCKINKSSPLSGIFNNEVLIMFLKYHKYNINLKNHLVPDEPFNCIA
ncbi:hypothetical protein V1477_006889 [Vespula maculifrons]|uniref:Uncharacterized protein n=1 Tax=Vespula maculifrons TaxID=7453 RepID=A0ABD2CH06_VESMC